MVVLNRIYTRTGDSGTTALASGERRSKADLRVETYGTVDETKATMWFQKAAAGGNKVAAWLDLARTVVRRAERRSLSAAEAPSLVVPYLNRLSDLLWTMARWQEGVSTITKELQ